MKCYIVKDLLPSVIDSLVSDETKIDVTEHLSSCDYCRLVYEQMKTPMTPLTVQEGTKEINYLKKIKKKTKITIAAISAAIVIVFCILAQVFAIGFPADFADVLVETEFQYDIDSNKEWVIHFKLTNGKALRTQMKPVIEVDADGNNSFTGFIITLYEVQPSSILFECDNYTFGNSVTEENIDYYNSSGFDFTVTVRYKDKEVVYSMRDEGLYN